MGYVFSLAGGAVSWKSHKQATVALSTAEAEFVAVSFAVCHAKWMRMLMTELGFEQKSPTRIWCDNSAAIRLMDNMEHQELLKHVDIQLMSTQEFIQQKVVTLQHLGTEKMAADILTKGVAKYHFKELRELFGMMEPLAVRDD
jgi:hypothetical protein